VGLALAARGLTDDPYTLPFERWCRQMRMPQAGIDAWLGGTAQPWLFMPFTWLVLFASAALPCVTFLYGGRHLPRPWRQAAGAAVLVHAAATCATMALVWCAGPDLAKLHRSSILAWLLAVPCHFFLDLWPATGPLERLPYQSRIAFLLSAGAWHWLSHAAASACLNPFETHRRTSSLLPVVWNASVKSLRAADSLSDLMYLRYLYDKVRSRGVAELSCHLSYGLVVNCKQSVPRACVCSPTGGSAPRAAGARHKLCQSLIKNHTVQLVLDAS
jgi:hypothetical protein